ncbi:MAG: chromate efflux transporter [Burkholderiales bacterium]|nr:chromate efflux transporter [Burkholderiales bacterium]
MPTAPIPESPDNRGSPIETFLVFLRLGLTSFGGPIAHLAYFRTEFVTRRRWLDDKGFADLVALCQFLPGPASSQVGIALGFGRCGWRGALAAWLGFTLPSAAVLVGAAYAMAHWAGLATSGAVHGLRIAAVAIVAQAVLGMSKALCPDRPRRAIAIVAALTALASPDALGQIAAIAIGGIVGLAAVPALPLELHERRDFHITHRAGVVLLVVFASLLLVLPLVAVTTGSPRWAAIASFYRAGALVFGGGHVVLPLLQAAVVPQGWISAEAFLAGYGVAQAIPGPLFAFAAYLGALLPMFPNALVGAIVLLLAVFLPGFLVVAGTLPFWEAMRAQGPAQRAMAGINAAVVGVLAAALYDPVWTGTIASKTDFGLALAAFGLLVVGRAAPALVVIGAGAAGWALALAA